MAPSQQSLQTHLSRRTNALLSQLGAPGAALALVAGGQTVIQIQLGQRGPEDRRPLHPQALFPIYSVTKTLIAAAVLMLVEEGQVGLDDPLETYPPDLPLPGSVTVRQALGHTGGLPDYGSLSVYRDSLRADPTRPWTAEAFWDSALAQGLRFLPGAGWAYSNIGYLLLRRMIEGLTGQTLAQVLRARLFAPLGLARTWVAEDLEDTRALTPGWSTFWGGDRLKNIVPVYHPGWVAHGVVVSTAAELAVLGDAIFTGRFFGQERLREMLTPRVVGGGHPVFRLRAYGLGVMMDGSMDGSVVGHSGGGPGFSAGMLHFRGSGPPLTSVALVNRDVDDAGLLLANELAEAWRSLPEGSRELLTGGLEPP